MIVRRSSYEKVGGFSPSLVYAMDWDMWARLAASGPVWHDPRPLAYYRMHAGSETFQQNALDRSIDCMLTVLRNSRLLPEDRRHQTIRAVCRYHLTLAARILLSPGPESALLDDKKKTVLHLLLRGQTSKKLIALAHALFGGSSKRYPG